MSRTLVYVPTTKPTTPTTMKNRFLMTVETGKLSLCKTQISIRAGHIIPNTDMHRAPTRLINSPMNGIAAATTAGIAFV